MKKFKFTLGTLLKKEKLDEKKRLGELGEIRSIRMKAVMIREGIDAEIDKTREKSKRNGNMTINALKEYNIYIKDLIARRKEADEKIKKIREEENRRLELVMETQKNIKGLEKLREKQYSEHINRVKKREEKNIEELISQKHVREQD